MCDGVISHSHTQNASLIYEIDIQMYIDYVQVTDPSYPMHAKMYPSIVVSWVQHPISVLIRCHKIPAGYLCLSCQLHRWWFWGGDKSDWILGTCAMHHPFLTPYNTAYMLPVSRNFDELPINVYLFHWQSKTEAPNNYVPLKMHHEMCATYHCFT